MGAVFFKRRWCAHGAGALIACFFGLQGPGVAALDDAAAAGPATGVTVPLQLDYPLLQRLMETQLFAAGGGSHDLLNDPSGCSEIRLSEPALSGDSAGLQMLAAVNARVGVGAPGACVSLLRWQGRIGVAGAPVIRNAGSAVGFEPERVWLLDPEGTPLPAGHRLQELADASARSLMRRYVVDLAPQLDTLAGLLPEVLPRHSRTQIEALLAALRLSSLNAGEQGVEADIHVAVEPASEPLPSEAPLTDEELARWETRWQLMDALLVLAVKHYAAATELQSLRDGLLDVLIESRYRLDDALAATADADDDPVRAWFLDSWQALAPVIRRIGLEAPGQEPLLLFSVIAATDALKALDQLGPAVGVDISADGLRRLARLISGESGDALLQYSGDVDPALQRLFRDSLNAAPPSAWRLDVSLFPRAHAASADRLNSWAPKREELEEYLPEIAALLESAAREAVAGQDLSPEQAELFRRVVLTTAWQESCWRHYVVSDARKLVPLRSGTGDVGLMQVNERVWRGFYDQQRLRWDIAYNGTAGVEVLLDYMVRYALRKGEHRQPGGLNNLARATYSAYNGGPSRLSRYRDPDAPGYGKKVDAAFWDKYRQVAAGDELAVSRCLGGSLSGPALARRGSAPAEPSAADAFVLQLGAFSSEAAARRFIRDNDLGAAARLGERRAAAGMQYLVLYGAYPSRQAAQSAQATLDLPSWVRAPDGG
jgi:hypothetical protein